MNSQCPADRLVDHRLTGIEQALGSRTPELPNRGNQKRQEHRDGQQRGSATGKPSQNEQCERRRFEQAPAQVVQQLPSGEQRQPVEFATPIGDGHSHGPSHAAICQSPRIQRWRRLFSTAYVAGYSSKTTTSVATVARAKQPFDQVVTQNPVVGETMFQKPVESGYVINALAGIGALAEQVVVQIGGRARILIQTGFAAEQTGVARCPAPPLPDGPRAAG